MSRVQELLAQAKKKKKDLEFQTQQQSIQQNSAVSPQGGLMSMSPENQKLRGLQNPFQKPNPQPYIERNLQSRTPIATSAMSEQERQQADSFIGRLKTGLGNVGNKFQEAMDRNRVQPVVPRQAPTPRITPDGETLIGSIRNYLPNRIAEIKGGYNQGLQRNVDVAKNRFVPSGQVAQTPLEQMTRSLGPSTSTVQRPPSFDVAKANLNLGDLVPYEGALVNVGKKIAGPLAKKVAPRVNKLLHPDDASALTDFINAIRNKKPVPEQRITDAERLLTKAGFSLDLSANKLADHAEDIITGKKKLVTVLPGTKKPLNLAMHGVGVGAGVGQDEQGNITYDPKLGLAGAVAGSLAIKGGAKISEASKAQKISQKGIPALEQGTQKIGKDVSSYYNVDRLKIPEKSKLAIKEEISNAGKELNATVGKTLSNKEVLNIASSTSKVLDKTVSRQQTADKIAANVKLRQSIADSVKNGKVDDNFIDLWMKDKSAGADIARQLQARKIVADPEEAKTINVMLDAIYKVNKNADEITKAAKGVDFNDAKQATEFYRSFIKPKASEWVDLLRYNSMLSSPNTHITNISSNLQGSGIVTPVEKTVTGIIDAIHSGITGKQREYYAGEGLKYAQGYYSKIGEASKRFVDVMRGKSLNLNPDIRNIPLATSKTGKVIEGALSIPTKMLEGMDQFFSAMSEGGVKKSLEYKASKMGKTLKNIDKLSKDEAAYRLFRNQSNEKQGVVLDAVDRVTSTLMNLRNSENPVVSTISKYTLPFVQTPMNILKQGLEYNPVTGPLTLIGAKNKTEQLAKIAIGTTSAAGAATLLGQDRLTFGEPINAKQKQEFRGAGRQPYSIKIGDNWYSYSKLHPALAFNFALISAVDDAQKNKKLSEDDSDAILSAFAKYGNFLTDQSYAKNIGDFLAATKGDEEKVISYFSNYPQQMIPFRALMGYITNIIDPVQRKVDKDGSILDKQMQQVMTSIPGLSTKVPARVDTIGNEIPKQNAGVNAISPVKVTTEIPQGEYQYQKGVEKRQQASESADIKAQVEKGITPELLSKTDKVAVAYGYDSLIKGDVTGDAPTDTAVKRQQASEIKKLYLDSNIPESVKPELYAKIGLKPEDVDSLMTLDDAGVALNKDTIKSYKENNLDSTDIQKLVTMKEDGMVVNKDTLDTYALYKEAKDLPKEEANAMATDLFMNDKKSFDDLKKIREYDQHGISVTEVAKYGITNGERANYLYNTLKSKSPEEANAIIKGLYKNGVVSKNVLKQMKQLKNQQ